MNKAIIPFFFCILVSVVASAQSRKTTDLMNEYLQAAFWKTGDNLQPLTKWAEIDTLKYVISGSFQFMSAKNWEKFTQEMGLLSGKVIVESPDDTYQILIHFGSLEEYSVKYKIGIPMNLTEKFSNWSNRTFGQNQELHTTSFCIDPNKVINYNEGEYYLQKLFIKSLGILGESSNEFSLFYEYYNENNERLTRADKRIIKLHYFPEIQTGMSHTEVKKVLEKLDLEALVKEKL